MPWPRAMRCPRAFMDRGACRLPGAKIADAKKAAGTTPLALEAKESAGRPPEAAPRDGGDSRARPSALRMWRKRRIRQKGGATGARPPCGKPGQPQAGGEGGQQDAGGWGERPRAPGLAKGANSRHGAGFVASCSRIRRRTGPGGGAPARAAVTTITAQARGRRRSGTRTGAPARAAAAPAILRPLPQAAPARPAPPRAAPRSTPHPDECSGSTPGSCIEARAHPSAGSEKFRVFDIARRMAVQIQASTASWSGVIETLEGPRGMTGAKPMTVSCQRRPFKARTQAPGDGSDTECP